MGRKRTSPVWKLTRDEFQELCNKSSSIKQILEVVGLQVNGSNPNTVKLRMEKDNICLKQFLINRAELIKQNHINISKQAVALELVMVINSTYNRCNLKKRLLKEGILKEICDKCGIGNEWLGERLVIQLEHKNGIRNDNRLENLSMLCPNCHSQTSSYAGKKLKKPSQKHNPKYKLRKVERPTKEELEKLVWKIPTTHIAKTYGVSDKAIEKWCKSYGITKPPRGYWQKKS